jgi:hypothetical protein
MCCSSSSIGADLEGTIWTWQLSYTGVGRIQVERQLPRIPADLKENLGYDDDFVAWELVLLDCPAEDLFRNSVGGYLDVVDNSLISGGAPDSRWRCRPC